MANGHGGHRPGAGRKRQETTDEQQNRRDIVLAVFDAKAWRAHVEGVRAESESGNYAAVWPLYPYLLGSPRQELNVTGRVEHVQMDAARQVLRIVGGTERAS